MEAAEPEEFVVTPALVEHLEKRFPREQAKLVDWGLDGAVNLALNQAKTEGTQAVLAYLRNLVKNPGVTGEEDQA